jgi:hypothetical protein
MLASHSKPAIIKFIGLAAGIGGQLSAEQIHKTHRDGCGNRAGLDEAAMQPQPQPQPQRQCNPLALALELLLRHRSAA